MDIPGYSFVETVFDNEEVNLSRLKNNAGNHHVLAKSLKVYNPEDAMRALEWEKGILDQLGAGGTVSALQIIARDSGPAILYEDFPGYPLAHAALRRDMDVEGFLSLALGLCNLLADVHARGVVHNGLSPWTVFIGESAPSPDTAPSQFRLACFERAARIGERHDVRVPLFTPASLVYASPEGTGKLRARPDARSDLYSLGIVLYELLCGRPPFCGECPAELIYQHVSINPAEPGKLGKGIPPIISRIIMKLLAKDPGERYRSVLGLRTDLRKCLETIKRKGKLRSFALDRHDSRDIIIPDRLYERKREMKELAAVYREAARGNRTIVMVSGPPGVGKTSLVMELAGTARSESGRFASGKFDQYRRDVPYAAFIDAFGELLRPLLIMKDEDLSRWKERIRAAVQPNVRLLTEIVPEMRILFGDRGDVPKTEPRFATNRLQGCIERFIGVFAGPEGPLVMFLDDLHWADAASLDLLVRLATSAEPGRLCIIGAYRDTEVHDGHPLARALTEISHRRNFREIRPGPLGPVATARLIGDALHLSPAKVKLLADLVYTKTQGNPYFIRELLISLSKGVSADLSQLVEMMRHIPVADSVAEHLSRRIETLPSRMKELLMTASCIGSTIDPGILSAVLGESGGSLRSRLDELAMKGLLVHEGNLYRFAHDKVQEAAYLCISGNERREVHYRIGTAMMGIPLGEDREKHLFMLTDHCNLASDLMGREEKISLVALNIAAARRAKEQAAHTAALRYLHEAHRLAMSSTDPLLSWDCEHDTLFNLHLELAEMEYLNGNSNEAGKLIDLAIPRTTSNIEKAELNNIAMLSMIAQDVVVQCRDIIGIGLKSLSLLDVDIDLDNMENEIGRCISVIEGETASRGIAPLIDLPRMDDSTHLTAMKIMRNLSHPAIHFDMRLSLILTLETIILTMRRGNAPDSAIGYIQYGIFLCSFFGRYDQGYQWGNLGYELARRFNIKHLICEANLKFANYIVLWKSPVTRILEINREGRRAGIESGDLQYAGYIFGLITIMNYMSGKNLDHVHLEMQQVLQGIRRDTNKFLHLTMEYLLSIITQFRETFGENQHDWSRTFDEQGSQMKESESLLLINDFYCHSSVLYYHTGHFEKALDYCRRGLQFLAGHLTLYYHTDFYFYHALIMASLYPGANREDRSEYGEKLSIERERFKTWSGNCPENFLHKFLLIEAEYARVTGDDSHAMELYDRAIEEAVRQGHNRDEATANRLAGDYWLARGKQDFSSLYLVRAHDCLLRWGARRLAEDLRTRHASAFKRAGKDLERDETVSQRGMRNHYDDTETLIAIARQISVETDYRRLFEHVLDLAVKYLAARRGYIIMERGGAPVIVAEVDSGKIRIHLDDPVPAGTESIPLTVIRYVLHTGETACLDNAAEDAMFSEDPCIAKRHTKSILCLNVGAGGSAPSVLYIENGSTAYAFSSIPREILEMLAAGIAAAMKLFSAMVNKKADAMDGLRYRTRGIDTVLSFADIVYLSSSARHTVIHTGKKAITIGRLMKDLLKELPGESFVRIHKQYVVNIDYVSHYKYYAGSQYVLFMNDEENSSLPLGRKYLVGVKKRLEER